MSPPQKTNRNTPSVATPNHSPLSPHSPKPTSVHMSVWLRVIPSWPRFLRHSDSALIHSRLASTSQCLLSFRLSISHKVFFKGYHETPNFQSLPWYYLNLACPHIPSQLISYWFSYSPITQTFQIQNVTYFSITLPLTIPPSLL